MMIPATSESANRRKYVVAWEPLFEILSEKMERILRFNLSYRSGISGGIMNYQDTGSLCIGDALELSDMTIERAKGDFNVVREGIRMSIVEAFKGKQ